MTKKTELKKADATTLSDPVENEWREFYVITEHWQSDFKFFADELRFLRSLVDKYFIWLIEDENIVKTRITAAKLLNFEKGRLAIENRLVKHSDHLVNLIANPFPHNAQEYRAEHADLETTVMEFSKEFRQIKKEIFELTEHVIESEKAKHLLRG